MAKEYWITNSRFKLIAILLMVIFFSLMTLFYLKADEVTKDPCGICSEKMGEEVRCTLGGLQPITKTFFPDGEVTISDPSGSPVLVPSNYNP